MYGKIIKQLRKNAGLKQADLARMVGVSRPNISFWENAEYPPLEAIDKICKVFGIELWRFFTDDSFDAQMKNLPEKYSNLQKEILQLTNEEHEDLLNVITIFLKKNPSRYTQSSGLKTDLPTTDTHNTSQTGQSKQPATDTNTDNIFPYTARMAAYNAIVSYTERFLRIM
jgi:transcriptional regulator with XRE-family HTH domain